MEHSDDLRDSKQDELAASTVTLATVRNKDFDGANADLCVPRQKKVHEMEFFDEDLRVYNKDSAEEMDGENLTQCNQVETVPLRHVSFAETVEMVEFDPAVHAIPILVVEYDAPAQTVAHQVHAALTPVVEYETPSSTVAHQVHTVPAPVVEYETPSSTVAHQVHTVPAPVDEYDAPAACATPSPSMDGLVVKVVHVPQVQVVEKTIEIPQLQTIEKIVEINGSRKGMGMHAWSMNGEMRRWILLRPLKWYSIGVVDGDGKVSTEAMVQLATFMHGEM